MNRTFGSLLLVLGVVLVILGVQLSLLTSDVNEIYVSQPTDPSIWMLLSGAFVFFGGVGVLASASAARRI